ncbi:MULTISPECIES: OB-fold nucleic acid binding domain-containing protein [Methanobacterium]|uniref:Replication protein A n=1 Tax=Methanobacterium bryantii TaxID=2161 RepID=A0A2A2H174_METBR|nr:MULTISPECIES: OB-fold nucleic acid binding domain-containing protein [Methanobacterium]OEC86574.1 replication protein A [Methanobacterium sp. A39]PAV03095.1 replication protein A [Methanobacterium bryantii]
MENDVKSEYQRISDKISYDDFLKRIEDMKKDYEDVSFMDELDIARMIVGEYIDEENVPLAKDNELRKISELETGLHDISITGRIMRISNAKAFVTKKGKEGKVQNIMLADDTGEIRVVLWTDNIKQLKNFSEGDIVKINNVEIKDGYRSEEAHLQGRSTIEKVEGEEADNLPEYAEKITKIADIKGEMQVNVIARVVRISRIRTYNSNGREGQFITLDLKDDTGSISLTLWNKDVEIINEIELKEGDSIKILGAQSRVRNDEVNLTHSWIGRIIKDNFDVPEYKEEVMKIGDAHEMKNVTLMGVVSKIQDAITFQRSDGSAGSVKSIVISDDTGSIKITLWNDDTKLDINKGDILKITGGNIEFDDYSETGYRVNTGWSSKIVINPEEDAGLKEVLEEHKKELEPIKIEDLHKLEDEGEEVDIIGRMMDLYDANEFQRADGTTGLVRSVKIADDTGTVRASLWDDKAKLRLNRGDLVKIENAKTRFRDDSVELSIGKTVRIIKISENDAQSLPPIDELEGEMYKPIKISALENIKSERDEVGIIGRIINLYDVNEFQRSNGTMGMVRTVELADDTGSVRASFWDEKAEMGLNRGDVIWIKNARPRFRNDTVELSVGRATMVIKPKDEDIAALPSLEEIEESIYKTKKIEELTEDDKNIKLSGQIIEAYGDRILYEMCPNCNKRVEYVDDAFVCDFCGEEIQQPNYLMIVPCVIEDDSGTVRTTFFRKQAEELIGMTTEKANEVIMTTADEGSLAGKVEDLIGSEITVIADASFDEYNEEIRLIAKKIVK